MTVYRIESTDCGTGRVGCNREPAGEVMPFQQSCSECQSTDFEIVIERTDD